MDYSKLNKVLIIRFSSLGDVLLTTPLIRTLKKQYPHLIINYLVKPAYMDVLAGNPYLNEIIVFNKDNSDEISSSIKKDNYDIIIDLQNNLRTRILTLKLGIPVKRFNKRTLSKFLLVKFKINLLKDAQQIPVRYSQAAGISLDDEGLNYFAPESLHKNSNEKIIGFAPGSKHFTKRWTPEYFIELGRKLNEDGYKVLLLGGKDDKEICENISNDLMNVENCCNDNNLEFTFNNMKRCQVIVCNDSGLMHTACAANVPVVALFGSTVKEFGFTPYRNKNLILENNLLSCRPCSHIGRSECPEGHFKCLLDLTPDLVFEKIKSLL